MRNRLILGLAVVAMLAGCGRVADSKLNPMNWFGRSEKVAVDTAVIPQDPRPLVTEVTDLRLERVPGGAIIRATGRPDRQGYFDGELVLANAATVAETRTLSYQFRVLPPKTATRPGTPQSREMIVGLFVSDQRLAGISRIQVSGASNALAVSR